MYSFYEYYSYYTQDPPLKESWIHPCWLHAYVRYISTWLAIDAYANFFKLATCYVAACLQ